MGPDQAVTAAPQHHPAGARPSRPGGARSRCHAQTAITDTGGGAGGSADHDGNGSLTSSPARGTSGQTAPAFTVNHNARDQAASFTAGSTYAQTYGEGPTQGQRQANGTENIANGPFGVWRTQETSSSQTQYYTRTPDGRLIGFRRGAAPNDNRYYYLLDRQSSVTHTFASDSNGTVLNAYEYTAYGVQEGNTYLGNPTGDTGGIYQPFRYISGYYDRGTELYHLGIRYYDPFTGIFLQPDPTGQDGGYLYSGANPISAKDPSGASSCSESAVAGAFGALSIGSGIAATSGILALTAATGGVGLAAGVGYAAFTSASFAGGVFGLGQAARDCT